MKRIKAMNGYTIYELTARDEKNGDGIEGEYAVYFSSDIREYGRAYSYPQWDGIDSLQEAEWLCSDRENVTYAKAKELCETECTCVSYEDIEEKIQELKQRGIDATAYETADELEEAMEETMNTYRVSFETAGGIPCANIARAQNADDVERHYESKGYIVYGVEQAYEIDIKIAERKGMPIITIEEQEQESESESREVLCRITTKSGIRYGTLTLFPDITLEQKIEQFNCQGIHGVISFVEEEEEAQQASPDIPDITIEQRWSRDDVRRTCIEQNWYTCGDCTAYEKMLNMVEHTTPTTENIYRVAQDICDHSEYQTISNIMFGLMHDAVLTFYTIDGKED